MLSDPVREGAKAKPSNLLSELPDSKWEVLFRPYAQLVGGSAGDDWLWRLGRRHHELDRGLDVVSPLRAPAARPPVAARRDSQESGPAGQDHRQDGRPAAAHRRRPRPPAQRTGPARSVRPHRRGAGRARPANTMGCAQERVTPGRSGRAGNVARSAGREAGGAPRAVRPGPGVRRGGDEVRGARTVGGGRGEPAGARASGAELRDGAARPLVTRRATPARSPAAGARGGGRTGRDRLPARRGRAAGCHAGRPHGPRSDPHRPEEVPGSRAAQHDGARARDGKARHHREADRPRTGESRRGGAGRSHGGLRITRLPRRDGSRDQ